jgi:pimeloyl-ACP methyl ester carboxylesterase
MLCQQGYQGVDEMARLPVFLMSAALLALAGCGPKPEVAAAATEPEGFADDWYVFSANPGGSIQIGLNVHQTKYGWQGRIWKSDRMYPVRNLVVADGDMSFIVPALEMSWSAKEEVAHKWRGAWISKEGETPAVMGASNPPELGGKAFVTLQDGRQMYLDCRGQGSPAVIFDSGAGGTSASWRMVHDEIAKTTLACAYDRAGHGLSDPRPLPLDAAAVADDLDATLAAAGVPAPYVLVGHSLGSYHVRQYANTRFDKMAGMVLVDPSGDGQTERFNAAIPNAVKVLNERSENAKAAGCPGKLREKLVMRDDPLFAVCNNTNDADVFEQTQSEIGSMPGASTEQLMESKRSYGAMPLIVLTRSDYKKGAPPEITARDLAGMKKVWVAMHDEMTALSTAGEHRTIADAGHNIQFDQPQAVIDAVNDVVARARGSAAKP